jgi:hypothetical protein
MPRTLHTPQTEAAEAQRVADKIAPDYLSTRVLPDGSVAALADLLFTRAIFLDCNEYGYGRRFCFEDRGLATLRFTELHTADDIPEGYTARRPEL